MAKKEKVLEHTSALQQNRTDPDMKVKPTLIIHRIICYIVLVFFSILCLFFFYILLVNASHITILCPASRSCREINLSITSRVRFQTQRYL